MPMRVPVDQHGGQGARRRRGVRRRAGVGDRVPGPARAAVRLLDGAAARARGASARREPCSSSRASPSAGERVACARAIACARVCAPPASPCRVTDRRSCRSLIGDNDRAVAVAHALQAEGFDVRAIRPPSVPPGTARLRVSRERRAGRGASLDRFVARGRRGAEGGRARAPRSLRNRHRHRRRQDGRVGAPCSCRYRSAAAGCATGSRFRPASNTTTTR